MNTSVNPNLIKIDHLITARLIIVKVREYVLKRYSKGRTTHSYYDFQGLLLQKPYTHFQNVGRGAIR